MRYGFIGVGDMGEPMARRLLAAEGELMVWNRSPSKLERLLSEGATAAKHPREVLENASQIGVCLSSHGAVEAICEGYEGLFANDVDGSLNAVVVDFSTGDPKAATRLSRRAAQKNIEWVDAPVSGGVPAAITGSLTIFAGGSDVGLNHAKTLLEHVGGRISHVGPSGSGQAMKLCNQMIVACNVIAVAEAIALARKSGIDVSYFSDMLRDGFADSAPLRLFGPRMANYSFSPRLGALSLMAKDVRLALGLATLNEARTPLLKEVLQIYEDACGSVEIDADGDISQLIMHFEHL